MGLFLNSVLLRHNSLEKAGSETSRSLIPIDQGHLPWLRGQGFPVVPGGGPEAPSPRADFLEVGGRSGGEA